MYLKICNSSENVSTRMLWKIRFVLFLIISFIYIYIYIERERERESIDVLACPYERESEWDVLVCQSLYFHIILWNVVILNKSWYFRTFIISKWITNRCFFSFILNYVYVWSRSGRNNLINKPKKTWLSSENCNKKGKKGQVTTTQWSESMSAV